jgi:hypothetical protein
MRWIFHVTLRPGMDTELKGKVDGPTEAEAMSSMDDWVREFGRPGEPFVWSREGPGTWGLAITAKVWSGEVSAIANFAAAPPTPIWPVALGPGRSRDQAPSRLTHPLQTLGIS